MILVPVLRHGGLDSLIQVAWYLSSCPPTDKPFCTETLALSWSQSGDTPPQHTYPSSQLTSRFNRFYEEWMKVGNPLPPPPLRTEAIWVNVSGGSVQGCLAHKKLPPTRTLK